MKKINFTNGQAPALNGTNLNQLQTNTEDAINELNMNITKNVLLFDGVAGKGEILTLNDDYTKYNFLLVVTGTDTEDFGSVLIGSTLSTSDEISVQKLFCTYNGQTQIHVCTLHVIDTKHLKINGAFWQRLANEGVAGLGILNDVYVRKIYGSM